MWSTRQGGQTREGERMVKTRTSRDPGDLPANEEPSRSRATSKNDQQAEHPTNVSRILEANMSNVTVILLFVLSLHNRRSLNSSFVDFQTFIETSTTGSCPWGKEVLKRDRFRVFNKICRFVRNSFEVSGCFRTTSNCLLPGHEPARGFVYS